ncbi:MAG TPA: hypothetical protein VF640_06000 [Acidimicrobiales bacterium]|jgi:hypothetical protein
MESSEGGKYQARQGEGGRSLELSFDVSGDRRDQIMRCLESGELRMVLQDVDVEQLSRGDLGGGYLWD